MSLPASKKDISENPTGNGVTAPTDPKFKEQDVERKMRFYGVIEAFRQGRYPNNAQIDHTLQYTLDNSPIDQSKLSSEGKTLIQDAQQIIATAKRIVAEKNKDELLQNFLYHTRHVDTSKGNLKDVAVPVGKDDASKDGQQAAEHLRTLGKLIFTNSEFRKILQDASILGRDILADAASKAAEVARPKEEDLAKVDEPAGSATWIGPNGEEHGPNDPVPDTGLEGLANKAKQANGVYQDAKSQVKDHAADAAGQIKNAQSGQSTGEDSARAAAQQGQQTAQEKAQGAKDQALNAIPDEHQERAKSEANDIANRMDAAQQGQGSDQDRAAAAAQEGAKTLKEKTLGRIPDEHKEKVKEHYNKGLDYMKEKFPEERRNRFIYRLKKVIVEQQRHRDYQDAVDFFLNMAETYHGHATQVASQGGDKGLAVRNDPAFKQAEGELRTLLERFANNASAQPIFDAIDQIYQDAQNDESLKEWFRSLDKYIRRVLQEPGYVLRDQCDEDGRKLRESGKQFWDVKYKAHKDNLFDQVTKFFTSFADDPVNRQFGQDWTQLTKDLLLDGDGNLKYKPHLWHDIRAVILPQLAQHIGYIPIPRVEYTDTAFDVVIENLTLESQNLFPNIIEIEAKNYFKLSPYNAIQDSSKHSVWISFSQIQADMRQVAFYFNKKSGFPKIKDHGLADVVLSGKGLSGKVHIESSSDKGSVFKVKEVKVKVDKLKFSIKDSKHQILYTTLRPLATRLIKSQISKAIQDGIRSGLAQLDSQLVEIRDRLDEAKDNEDLSRTSVIKDVFTSKKNDAASKAEDANKKTGTFKLVAKRESKIVDYSSPNSIVEKQGDRFDFASEGEGWKSKAFDIVS